MNVLKQTFAVFRYLISTWRKSWGGAASTALGFVLVAATLIATQNLAAGISDLWHRSGEKDIAIILSASAFSEMNSRVPASAIAALRQAPGLAGGTPIMPEFVGSTTLFKRSNASPVTVVVRGIHPETTTVSSPLLAGRRFTAGKDEIIVGDAVAAQMRDGSIGSALRVGNRRMEVVGILDGAGGLAASEIHGDGITVADALGAPNQWSVVKVKLADASRFAAFASYLESIPGLNVSALRESELYARQGARLRDIVMVPGVVLVVLMAIAACLGAVNTLQSAVLSRLRELATMRAIGFSGGPLVMGLLMEAGSLALVGASLGAALTAAVLSNATLITSTGMHAVAISMHVTAMSVAIALGASTLVGVIGGLWPALNAMRANVVESLRAA